MTFLISGVWLVAAALVALWVCRAWSSRWNRARTRAVLVKSGTDAIVVLAAVRAIDPPPAAWRWLWLVAAACVGVGLAGALVHWPGLPWRDPRRGRRAGERSAMAGTVAYAAVGAGLLAVLA
jgi:hypothetical protein